MARFEIIDGRCVIPHGVTEILEEEFADCQELKEVVIPDTVVNIGMGAFMECHSLQSVTIPRSVTKIPHCAFFWCTSLKEVFIPDSVKVIGPQAFEGCAKLRSVTIPEGVEDLLPVCKPQRDKYPKLCHRDRPQHILRLYQTGEDRCGGGQPCFQVGRQLLSY